MNQPAQAEDNSGIIDSLLVPLVERTLLVPMALVAEVIKIQPSAIDRQPDRSWLYGWFLWRERRLPLISLESLADEALPEALGERIVVTVFNAISDRAPFDFYALVTQGFPRSIRITEDDELAIRGENAPLGLQVEIARKGSSAVIPDLDWVEKQLTGLF